MLVLPGVPPRLGRALWRRQRLAARLPLVALLRFEFSELQRLRLQLPGMASHAHALLELRQVQSLQVLGSKYRQSGLLIVVLGDHARGAKHMPRLRTESGPQVAGNMDSRLPPFPFPARSVLRFAKTVTPDLTVASVIASPGREAMQQVRRILYAHLCLGFSVQKYHN